MAIEIDTGTVVGGGGLAAVGTVVFGFLKWRQDSAAKRDEAVAKREESTVNQYIVIVNALQADIVRLNAAREADIARLNAAREADAARYAAELQSIRGQLNEEMQRRNRDWEDANGVRNGLAAQLNHVLKWCATQGYAPPEMAPGDGSNLYPSLAGPKSKVTPKEPT